jgi:hypothetical protein
MRRKVFVRATSNTHLPGVVLPRLAVRPRVAVRGAVRVGREAADVHPLVVHRRYCPGRKPPFLVVKRPARPYKSTIDLQN